MHRLRHEAAHGGDALLKDRALVQAEAIDCLEAPFQLLPDALVGPFGEVFVGPALKIQAADLRSAHAEQREAALVVGIDQLVGCRRGFGQNPEPAEWVGLLVNAQNARGDRRPADSVEAVAARDEIARDLALFAAAAEVDARRLALEAVDADGLDFEDQMWPPYVRRA